MFGSTVKRSGRFSRNFFIFVVFGMPALHQVTQQSSLPEAAADNNFRSQMLCVIGKVLQLLLAPVGFGTLLPRAASFDAPFFLRRQAVLLLAKPEDDRQAQRALIEV